MASIKMVSESEATGTVPEVDEEIKSTLGIDFVPNLYKVMAAKPGYLQANWNKVKTVMVEPGKLDRLTKEVIVVALSAVRDVNTDSACILLRCRSWGWMTKRCSSSWQWSICSADSTS